MRRDGRQHEARRRDRPDLERRQGPGTIGARRASRSSEPREERRRREPREAERGAREGEHAGHGDGRVLKQRAGGRAAASAAVQAAHERVVVTLSAARLVHLAGHRVHDRRRPVTIRSWASAPGADQLSRRP
jgi:hypothetical protein